MNIIVSLFATALFIGSEALPSPGEDHKVHYAQMPMCMGKELNLPEGLNGTWKTCLEKVFGPLEGTRPPKDKEHKEFLCVMVCQAQELGLIDQAGKLKADEIELLMEDTLPEEAVPTLKAKLKLCVMEFGNEVKTTKGDCSSISLRYECTKKAFMDVCMTNVSPTATNNK